MPLMQMLFHTMTNAVCSRVCQCLFIRLLCSICYVIVFRVHLGARSTISFVQIAVLEFGAVDGFSKGVGFQTYTYRVKLLAREF